MHLQVQCEIRRPAACLVGFERESALELNDMLASDQDEIQIES